MEIQVTLDRLDFAGEQERPVKRVTPVTLDSLELLDKPDFRATPETWVQLDARA